MMRAPRLFDSLPMTLLGREERYSTSDAAAHIPAQWAWFAPRIAELAGREGGDTFGLCREGDGESFSYFCGVRIPFANGVQDGLVAITIPPLRFAVFDHERPLSELRRTISAAFMYGLPAASLAPYRGVGAPDLIEHYGDTFDPKTGTGPVAIWIPIGPTL